LDRFQGSGIEFCKIIGIHTETFNIFGPFDSLFYPGLSEHKLYFSIFEKEAHAMIADDCTIDGAPTPDRDEITEVVLLDPAAFAAHVRSGDMTDMDAGLLALDHLGLA
jgi:hypothetical protein